jgi:uncharacterized protein (TIGR00375 family)
MTERDNYHLRVMSFIADLHIHSKFSRATSPDMMIPQISRAAQMKGITLCATGDFTHPEWLKLLQRDLTPTGTGLFKCGETNFILSAEVNNASHKRGKFHQMHNVLFVPSFEAAGKINDFLEPYGTLRSDGRPTLRLDTEDMLKEVLALVPDVMYVPAHIWTPWFSLFGSKSGFDSIEECLGSTKKAITALETGLSSDPPMNWRLSELDPYSLISNSDAHSPSRLGREANVFECELSYAAIRDTLVRKDKKRFCNTIEFFPEEGKYHYDGHRQCNVRLSPKQSLVNNDLCPVCGKHLTVGVLHRVENLADRPEGTVPDNAIPFKSLVPLEEIIAQAIGAGRDTAGVKSRYDTLVKALGGEFNVLMNVPVKEIELHASEKIAQGIANMREGKVLALPGYDGVFGTIDVFGADKVKPEDIASPPPPNQEPDGGQMSLF